MSFSLFTGKLIRFWILYLDWVRLNLFISCLVMVCLPAKVIVIIASQMFFVALCILPRILVEIYISHFIPPTKMLFCSFYSYKTFLWEFQYLWIIHTLHKYLACGQDRGGHCSLREYTPFKWLLQFALFETLILKYF